MKLNPHSTVLLARRQRIVIIINHFGRWPEWIDLFIESCKRNQDITWLINTDCGEPENWASNVLLRQTTLESYTEFVSRRLGVDLRLSTPYKLCDIRPALGHIHCDQIAGHDFWGYGDIDVVYGDIRSFYTDDLLRQNDLISTHDFLVSGHLAIIRNNWMMRNAFRHFWHWRESITAGEYVFFDEYYFSMLFWRRGRPPGIWKHIPKRLNPYFRRALFREQYSTPLTPLPWINGAELHPQIWIWRDGRLTNDQDAGREFLYLHFMNWKNVRYIARRPPDGKAAWEKLDQIMQVGWREASRHGCCISPLGITSLAEIGRVRQAVTDPG
jgi:hypothetical protein